MNRRRRALLLALVVAATMAGVAGGPITRVADAQPTATTTTLRAAGSSVPRAGASRQVLLLVDTSGSMDEDDGTGRIKIDGARQALIDFVRSVPPGSPVGLRTYPGGTESENGCSKGRLRVSLSESNLSNVDAEVRTLSADGDTPTSAALRQAAEDLKGAGDGSGTIVLVSDGQSNCGPDPCDVAKQVSASGIDVTVNTVGFRISQSGRAQLQCIADATHGRYGDVGDNQQLVDELNRLAQPLVDVRLDYPEDVKAAVGQDASGSINVVATIRAVGAGEVHDAEAELAFDIDNAPAVISPRRRLGNLPPGGSTSVTWTFRPPLEEVSRPLDFTVTAGASNSQQKQVKGHINLSDKYDLADAGPLLKGRSRVVILGDSYSAGEGGEEYLSGTDTEANQCHRSPNTYGTKLFTDAGLKPDNFACSGALTRDLRYPNEDNHGEPAQTDHLRTTPYDLAMLSIGGNDIGFPLIGVFCAATISCQDQKPAIGAWPTFEELVIGTVNGLLETEIDALRRVEEALNSADNLKKRRGPAPLVVMGYPSAVPLVAGLRYLTCSFAYDPGEMRFVQRMVYQLNGVIQTAVTFLHQEGRPIYFVPDVIDSFQPDHTYCGDSQWVHRLNPLNTTIALTNGLLDLYKANPFTSPDPKAIATALALKLADTTIGTLPIVRAWKEQLHPTRLGYRAMTKELVRWSTSPAANVPVTRATHPKRPSAGDLVVLKQAPTPVVGSTVKLQPGGEVRVQMTGLMPQSPAALVIQSRPAVLDQVVADADGRAVFRASVPSGAHIGRHDLVVYLTRPDGTVGSVMRPVKMRRPYLWWDIPLAVAGILLVLAGFAFLSRRRRIQS